MRWGKTVAGVAVAGMLMVGAVAPVSACPISDPEPVEIPQFLRDALYTDAYKAEDAAKYDQFYAKSTRITFRTTNDFPIYCDMGMPLDEDGKSDQGDRGLLCVGKMPPGTRWGITSTYPIPTNKRLVQGGIRLDNYESAPAFAGGDDTLAEAWQDVEILPIGSKIWIPKVDPKQWAAGGPNRTEANNWSITCVVPDQHRVGCLRSDNHGFWLDQYGTHTF